MFLLRLVWLLDSRSVLNYVFPASASSCPIIELAALDFVVFLVVDRVWFKREAVLDFFFFVFFFVSLFFIVDPPRVTPYALLIVERDVYCVI